MEYGLSLVLQRYASFLGLKPCSLSIKGLKTFKNIYKCELPFSSSDLNTFMSDSKLTTA